MELNELGQVAMLYGAATAKLIFGAVVIGIVLAIVLLVIYGRMGVFRRSGPSWYNWLVKLWIPYLLIVAALFAFKIGTVKAVEHAALASKSAGVEVLYDRAVAPALGNPAQRAMFLAAAQGAGMSVREMGHLVAARLKEQLPDEPGNDLGSRLGSKLAAKVIDRYSEDLVVAVLYGVMSRTEGSFDLHSANKAMSFEDWRSAMDILLTADLAKVEGSIKTNLNGLLDRVIKDQFGGMFKINLLIAALLLLLPLAEWGIYRWRKTKAAPAPEVVEPQGDAMT